MHLTHWAAADLRFSIPHLLEKCARNHGQGDRGVERRARARGLCVGAALESESIKCAWAGAGACARSRCAPGGGAASASGRAQPSAGGARRDACENFSPAPQVRVPAFRGAVLRRQPRVPAPPPLPPPASSSFPAPRAAGPQGTPQAQPHPAGAARSHAPAAACRERTQRASGARALQVGGECGVGLRCGGLGPRSTGTWGALLRPPSRRPRASPLLGNSLPLASSGAGGAGTEGVRSPFP